MSTPIDMSEPVRVAEIVPASLRALRDELREHYQVTTIWDVGDADHDYGYHRSRAWILSSRYSRFGEADYSVLGGLDRMGGSDWIAALDIALPREELDAILARLDPRPSALREVLDEGNHIHLSLYRGLANADHTALFNTITSSQELPSTEENDDMKMILLQGAGIALQYIHPFTGELVWTNAVSEAAVEGWRAAGVPLVVVDDIGRHGRQAEIVAKELLEAVRSGGTILPSGPLSFHGSFSATQGP